MLRLFRQPRLVTRLTTVCKKTVRYETMLRTDDHRFTARRWNAVDGDWSMLIDAICSDTFKLRLLFWLLTDTCSVSFPVASSSTNQLNLLNFHQWSFPVTVGFTILAIRTVLLSAIVLFIRVISCDIVYI